MIEYKKARIFFGTQQQAIIKNQHPVKDQHFFKQIADLLQVETLYYINQVHSAHGVCVNFKQYDHNALTLLDADFLICNQTAVALAVFTADCVPVMIYDSVTNTIAAVHAGWKGIVAGVIPEVLMTMQKNYAANLENLQVFIGPCAKSCCYEVKNDVYCIFQQSIYINNLSFFTQKKNSLFLDLPSCVEQQLIAGGVLPCNINKQFALCTLCNTSYCSYRRDCNSLRNVNVIVMQLCLAIFFI